MMTNNYDLAQFKLTSGHEILCEVMEWGEDGDTDIIVRNVMQIVVGQGSDDEIVFMFRPWLQYLESNEEYVLISTRHIISSNRPNINLIHEYKYAVEDMHMTSIERSSNYHDDRQEINETMERLQKSVKKACNSTAPSSNIIHFPNYPKKDDSIH